MEGHIATLVLTRPLPASRRVARTVRAAGWPGAILFSPIFEIVTVPGAVLPAGTLVFTSENGVRAAAGLGVLAGRVAVAVGERTARVARGVGAECLSAGGTVDDLEALLLRRGGGPYIHCRGRNAAGDLACRLRSAGFAAEEVVLYDQQAVPLGQAARDALAGPRAAVLPLFSPRIRAVRGRRPAGFAGRNDGPGAKRSGGRRLALGGCPGDGEAGHGGDDQDPRRPCWPAWGPLRSPGRRLGREVHTVSEDPTTRPEPPATEMRGGSGSSGFLAVLLGGFIAGGIGYLAAYYTEFELFQIDRGDAEIEQLSAAFDAQADRLSALESAAEGSPSDNIPEAVRSEIGSVSDTVAAISARLDELETDPGTDAATQEAADSLAGLQDRLAAIESQTGDPGVTETDASQSQQLSELSQRLDDLNGTVESQAQKLASQAEKIDSQAQTIQQQKQTLESQSQAIDEAKNAARRETTRISAHGAVAEIRGAIESGEPYADAIGEIRETSDVSIPEALSGPAGSGVASSCEPQRGLPRRGPWGSVGLGRRDRGRRRGRPVRRLHPIADRRPLARRAGRRRPGCNPKPGRGAAGRGKARSGSGRDRGSSRGRPGGHVRLDSPRKGAARRSAGAVRPVSIREQHLRMARCSGPF